MKEDESIDEFFAKVTSVINQMATNGEALDDQRVVEKILCSMLQKYFYLVIVLEELDKVFTLEYLQGTLKAYEEKINLLNPQPRQPDQALKYEVSSSGGRGSYNNRGRGGNFRGRGGNSQGRGRSFFGNNYSSNNQHESNQNSGNNNNGNNHHGGKDPISFDDANKEEKWQHAMLDEIKAIEKNDTLELIDLPSHKIPIGTAMMKEFEMTDLGELHHFLGIEVHQSKNGFFTSQENYAKEILRKFKMENANPVSTSCITGLKLSKNGEGKLVDSTLFQSLVGNLMYLTTTRPDIMYDVSLISRFMEKPFSNHGEAIKRILRYVRGTLDHGIFYQANIPINLVGYTNSDLAWSVDDSKSTSGYIFNLGSGAISWYQCSKKQPIVALSTTEAEYIAASIAGSQLLWLRGILEELNKVQKDATTLFCDNCSTISVSKDPVLHGRTKHIRMRFHFLQELVNERLVDVKYCKLKEQVADIFTKPLGGHVFKRNSKSVDMVTELSVCNSSFLDVECISTELLSVKKPGCLG
ncbi:hypothetical protein EZV62_008476 [Acer yangbiense]|uniref:Reverse transcriptase Ty1/copia-type domain-containing protein n=1 Tax=Acer yangbiense TaxID=1000413 RepID=A0A5C7IDE6_9ROSI|nr:hypothetical protein EZV62_008476 [Acer yangbiense]